MQSDGTETKKLESLIEKGREAREIENSKEDEKVEDELKDLMRGFFDSEARKKMERLEKQDRVKSQTKLIELLEEKVNQRNAERRKPEEDAFVLKEIEELEKGKNESVRMRELLSERRLSAIKKRKMSDFHVWRKKAIRERKRIKKEERGC